MPLNVTLSALKWSMQCPDDQLDHDSVGNYRTQGSVLEGEEIRSKVLMQMPMQKTSFQTENVPCLIHTIPYSSSKLKDLCWCSSE